MWWAVVWMVAFAQNWGILQTRIDQREDDMEVNFQYFQIKKAVQIKKRVQNVDAKNEVTCIFSMFPSWVMVLKLSKKVHILQYCGDLSKKLRSVKAICIYSSESSHYTLSKNNMVYRGLSHCSWDINNWNIERDADSVET